MLIKYLYSYSIIDKSLLKSSFKSNFSKMFLMLAFCLDPIYVKKVKYFKYLNTYFKIFKKSDILNRYLKTKFDERKRRLIYRLRVSFKRKNAYFIVLNPWGRVIGSTSITREGFKGRRRKEFVSMQITVKKAIKLLHKLYINMIKVTIVGFNRFRFLIKKLIRREKWGKRRLYRVSTKMFTLIPHNGCRPVKSKNRRRIKWKRFFKRKVNLKSIIPFKKDVSFKKKTHTKDKIVRT